MSNVLNFQTSTCAYTLQQYIFLPIVSKIQDQIFLFALLKMFTFLISFKQLGHLRHNHDGEKASEGKICQLCAEPFGSIRELVNENDFIDSYFLSQTFVIFHFLLSNSLFLSLSLFVSLSVTRKNCQMSIKVVQK